MGVIFRLALRNLKEHKSKTIIIALFIMFGSAIVILGNSFLESINKGLEKDFRANYTGDLAIAAVPEDGTTVDIIGADTTTLSGELPQIKALPDMDRVLEILSEESGIRKQTKLISAKALMTKDEEMNIDISDDDTNLMDIPVFMLYAGEDETYFDTFPGQHIIEGRLPDCKSGENELLIDTRVRDGFEKFYKDTLNVGDKVLVAGANINAVLREATVVGFFKPTNEHSAMFQIIYCNPNFARAFADLTYGSSIGNGTLSNVDTSIGNLSEDDMFGSDEDIFSIDEDESLLLDSETDFNSILGDTTLRDQLNQTDEGAWHFILAKLERPWEADALVAKLNARFAQEGLKVKAMNWKDAARSYTATVAGISLLFNILVIILAVVVFIIIMNTMTVSVIERTSEIGTMRALGSEKSFVRKLFFTEAVSVTFVSSVAGTALAILIALIFNQFNLSVDNFIAKMILGGGEIKFSITPGIIISTIVIAILGSVLSNVYPVKSALKITPLKALSKGGE